MDGDAAPTSAPGWQEVLRRAVRDVGELAALLELPLDSLGAANLAQFPLLVPRGFVARMRKADARDPLLLQVLPRSLEHASVSGYVDDPLREHGIGRDGALQKYAGRALLVATGACPVHCRYCFRRAFPYDTQNAVRADWDQALNALAAAGANGEDIREVILSGGDPLTLSNRRLAALIGKLESTSVETLRIHSRFPIVIPERVDRELLRTLRESRLKTVMVVHCNHANELDESVAEALLAIRDNVELLLNQSVLLRDVNDSADALVALSSRLFDCGTLPYYLHLLDRVTGAAHFEVPEAEGRALIAAVRARLPGYLVPRLVREIPGELNKTLIS